MKPRLVYDDDCLFCTDAVRKVNKSEDYVLIGFSELTDEERQRLPEDYERCAHVITKDEVYSCGDVVRDVLYRTTPEPFCKVLNLPGIKQSTDYGYYIISQNRGLVSKLYCGAPLTDCCFKDSN